MRIWFRLFCRFNRLVAKMIGAVGWCGMSYLFNRTGFIIREERFEDYVHSAQNPVSAWWGAFMFEWEPL